MQTRTAQSPFRRVQRTLEPPILTEILQCLKELRAADKKLSVALLEAEGQPLEAHRDELEANAGGGVYFLFVFTCACPDRSDWFPAPSTAATL